MREEKEEVLIIDLGIFGKHTITSKEWEILKSTIIHTQEPGYITILTKIPRNLHELFMKMYTALAVKYNPRIKKWIIDYHAFKIHKQTPAKTTETITPRLREEIAREILKYIVKTHGLGKTTKPFPYPGGDWYIKDKILEILVKSNCKTLVEVFGGSGVISMYAPREIFKNIIYNDKDSLLTNFFTVLKDKPEELVKKLAITPISRELFKKYREIIETGEIHKLDPVEKAAITFYMLRYSMWGKGDSVAIQHTRPAAVQIKRQIALLTEYAKMWSDIVIENRDFRDIIKLYDREQTIFYCDPPHLSTKKTRRDTYYRLEFTEKDMKDLLNILSNITGKFLLKLPEDHLEIDFIKKWIEENKYNTKTIEHAKSMQKVKNEERPVFKTILIYNYNIK